MKIVNSVKWNFDRIVSAKFFRGNNEGADSDVDDKVRNGDCEGSE